MVAAGLPIAPPTYVLFVLAAATLIVTPGPDTLFVLSCGIENRTAGLRAALGVTTGILFHTALVVVGVAAVYRTVPGAERVVRVAGGLYLCYLGVDTLRSAGEEASPTGGDGVREGFLVNALNPQVALFFLAFLPGFVGRGGAGEAGGIGGALAGESGVIALLGVTYAVLTAVYLAVVAVVADGAAGVIRSEATGRRLDRVAGGILLLLGVWVLVG
jgi:threonine/homoserine/homoserine lactone efflux protein